MKLISSTYLHVSILLCFFIFTTSCATSKVGKVDDLQIEDVYKKTLVDRTAKILEPLKIEKKKTFQQAQFLLVKQYTDVNKIHENFKIAKAASSGKDLSSSSTNVAANTEEEKKIQLKSLQTVFIKNLGKVLNKEKIEQIKDGMTYGVLPKTWKAYQEMLMNLTVDQKTTIYNYLVEARELAMTEGSSDAKHAMFGKYKGKINNYLSAQGYDMKQESKNWEARIKKQKETNIIN